MAKETRNQKAIRGYILGHLAETCTSFGDLQSDLLEAAIHPGRMPYVDEQRAVLEKLCEQKLSHIERVIADLRRLK